MFKKRYSVWSKITVDGTTYTSHMGDYFTHRGAKAAVESYEYLSTITGLQKACTYAIQKDGRLV